MPAMPQKRRNEQSRMWYGLVLFKFSLTFSEFMGCLVQVPLENKLDLIGWNSTYYPPELKRCFRYPEHAERADELYSQDFV